MQITGSYMNYMTMTSLLSPLGVESTGDYIMQVFSSSLANLQEKTDQQVFSEESTEALAELYSQVSSLSSEADRLTLTDTDSVFNDRTATSSDSDILTATAWDAYSQDTGATEATYNISVSQLASAQKNSGADLNGNDSSVVDSGVNTFNISINGQDHELNIEVEEGDTNEDVLQKIETAVNESGLGITAEIISNDDGTLALVLESDDTGTDNSFTISDVSGNAIAATAADNISTEARDAAYSVDGEAYTSGSNTIYLEDGKVTVNLQGTGDAVLKIGPDEDEVYGAVSSLISEINSFIDFYNSNSDYIKEDVLSSINSIISDHEDELESLGITITEDGTLEIDSDALAAAISQDPSAVKEVFGGFDGLAVEISNYASGIATDSPLNYAVEGEELSTEFSDYIYSASAEMMKEILLGSMLDTYL